MQGLAPTLQNQLVLFLTALLLAALLHAFTLLELARALSPQSRLHFHPRTVQLPTCLEAYNQSESLDTVCTRLYMFLTTIVHASGYCINGSNIDVWPEIICSLVIA